MEKIIKNVNLNDFKNYSLNPNLKVWNMTTYKPGNKPIQNIPGNRGDFDIVANIKVPNQDFTYFSYHDCFNLFNDLQDYQNTTKHLCSLCSNNPNDISQGYLSQYIDSSENWYYKEGLELYPYLYYLITDDFKEDENKFIFKPLTYHSNENNPCFWNDFTTHLSYPGITIEMLDKSRRNIDISNVTVLEGYNEFINEYITTKGKIGQIIDFIYDYVLNQLRDDISNISDYDIYTDIKNQCYDYVLRRASDFFTLNFSCNHNRTITHEDFVNLYKGKYVFDEDKPPKLKLPILLSANTDDIGILTTTAKEWIPGQRYYIDDVVIYDGQYYILKSVNSEGYYAGDFNYIENIIYFDNHERNSFGLFNGFSTDSADGELVHWKLTVDNKCHTHTVINETESLLYTLKGLVPDNTIANFFDVEGKYPSTYKNEDTDKDEYIFRNISEIERDSNGVVSYYRSYIKNISEITYYDINDVIVIYTDENVANGSIVKREIVYEYVINEISTQANTGIEYTDTITSNIVNAADFEWSEPTVTTTSKYTIYSFGYSDYREKIKTPPSSLTTPTSLLIHSNNEVWVNTPLIKEEYLFGINGGKPKVKDNINIERGIIYSQDKHMALGEIKTFTQLLTYNNGSFWKIYDNTKRKEEE